MLEEDDLTTIESEAQQFLKMEKNNELYQKYWNAILVLTRESLVHVRRRMQKVRSKDVAPEPALAHNTDPAVELEIE